MRLFWTALWALVVLLSNGAAQAQTLRTPHVESALVSAKAAIAPGERFTVGLRQSIIPDWHTYWTNPGDSGEPVALTWRLPEGFAAGEARHPAPSTERVQSVMTYVHKDEVLFPIEMRTPASLKPGETVTLAAHVFYLVCSDICLTEEGDVSLTIPVASASRPDPVWAPRIEAAEASIPRDEGWSARISGGPPARLSVESPTLSQTVRQGRVRDVGFFPFEPEAIRHAEPQRPAFGARGVTFSLAPGLARNLGQVELAGVVAFDERTPTGWLRRGVEVRAVPGEPLPDTGAAAQADASVRPSQSSGNLTFPVAILFAFIGGLILNVMPCVLPVLAIKAVGFAQGAHAAPRETRRAGSFYTAGVLATFLALAGLLMGLRSAGEAVGWAFQLQEPWLVAALALLFFAIGLNLLGVFHVGGGADLGSKLISRGGNMGAFASGALAVIVASPCTAPFMAGAMGFALVNSPPITLAVFAALALGFAAPIALLSFAPALQRLIPKPGAWMARFKQVLAFPMFGAAVWLAWVLTVQQGASGALALLSLVVALAFALFVARWGRVWAGVGIVLLAAAAGLAWSPLTRPAQSAPQASGGIIPSEAWSAERLAALRAQNRPVFVNFTAAWCVNCKANEAGSLSSPRVAAAFRAGNVVYLKADWTTRDAAIAAELARHGRAGIPLYLYYAPGAQTPRILPPWLTENLLLQTVAPSS